MRAANYNQKSGQTTKALRAVLRRGQSALQSAGVLSWSPKKGKCITTRPLQAHVHVHMQ